MLLPPVDGHGADSEVDLFSDGSKSSVMVGATFGHLHASVSNIGSHHLGLPECRSVFDAELYSASFAHQPAANLSPGLKVVSLSIDSQAILTTISGTGYSYSAPLHYDIRKATFTLLFSDTAV